MAPGAERLELSVDGATVVLRREPWDCAQLGLESAKVEHLEARDAASAEAVVRRAVAEAKARGYVHLASRVDTGDRLGTRALQAAGFRLVDTVVHLAVTPKAFKGPVPDVAGLTLRWATAGDADALGELSARAFSDPAATFNRYLNDPRLTPEQVRRVYFTWGRTSVGGPAADATLVVMDGARLAGYLTLKHPDVSGKARVPLNAVDDAYRGKGLYRWLVSEAARRMFERGATKLEVTTQLQQLAVQKTWWQLGGALEGSSYSFHLWR